MASRRAMVTLTVLALMCILQTSFAHGEELTYLTTFESDANNSVCNISIGVTKTTVPTLCNTCETAARIGNYVIDCDDNSNPTQFSYGCHSNTTCENCTKSFHVEDRSCFLVDDQTEPYIWTRVETTNTVEDCGPGEVSTSTAYLAEYIHSEPPDENITNVCHLTNETTRISKLVVGVTGVCTMVGNNSYTLLNRTKQGSVTIFNGGLGCQPGCTNCTFPIDSWASGSCNRDNVTNQYFALYDCSVNPSPSGGKSPIPDELLAVGILVLVIATFFIIQACHKASKKRAQTRSLNADGNDSDRLVEDDKLTRDYTGRVSFHTVHTNSSSTSIVEAERRMAATARATDKTAPIVETEKILAAVHAEKASRGGQKPTTTFPSTIKL